MKGFSVLALLLLAFVYVKCEGSLDVANLCKTEAGATDADIDVVIKHLPAASREAKCMRACFMKKLGAINAAGKLDKDVSMQLVQLVAKGDAKVVQFGAEVMDICTAIEIAADECEAAEQYGACLLKEATARGIDLSVKF